MSALDTTTGSFLPETLPTDLPTAWEPDFQGTSALPDVSEIPRSAPGVSITGILDAVSATAKAGLDIFKTVSQIDMAASTAGYQREMQRSTLDLERTKLNANVDIAKTRATTERDLAQLQAKVAVNNAQAAEVNSRGGSFVAQVASSPNLITWALGAAALYLAFRKKGAAA